MEKVREMDVKRIVHEIYCDRCEKYLQTSVESDDGWYANNYKYEKSLYINGRYSINKTLCQDCREIVEKKLTDTLVSLGFKKE